jgi:hypothetical protein
MGNSASSEIKQQTQHHDSWVTPEDHLKHKHQHIPVPDLSLQNCSNLGINVGSEKAPYNLCMCAIATHGEYENIPLEKQSNKQTFKVPENAEVFVFSTASPGTISRGLNDIGPKETMRYLFPNVYTPIDPNVKPITIRDAYNIIKDANIEHSTNTKISAIRDSALNFAHMKDKASIITNMDLLSKALKEHDYKYIYIPLQEEMSENEKNPDYEFTDEDEDNEGLMAEFDTSNSYTVRQYEPNERMYIKKYTVSNKDRGDIIYYSYDWNIYELFSGCNLTKFLSMNLRSGQNYVTNQTIIEHCARVAENKGIKCKIILFDLSCAVFLRKGYDVTPEDKAILKKNLTEEMDAGGARNKRKHITHRKKNIKNRKINIKHKKRVTKKNKIFRRVH